MPQGPVEERMIKRQSNSEDQEFLNAHNNKRRIVSPTAANMKEMVKRLHFIRPKKEKITKYKQT